MAEQSVSECGENILRTKRAWLENYICENLLEPWKEKKWRKRMRKRHFQIDHFVGRQEEWSVPSSVLPIVTCNKTLWISKCLSIYKRWATRRGREEKRESLLAPTSFADGWIFEGKAVQGQLSATRFGGGGVGATCTWGVQWKRRNTLGRCRHWA